MGSVPGDVDLNLLRVFDAVVDTGSVSDVQPSEPAWPDMVLTPSHTKEKDHLHGGR